MSEVLGIESYIRPEGWTYPQVTALYFQIDEAMSEEEKSLFEKIVKAMGLKDKDFKYGQGAGGAKIMIHFAKDHESELGRWESTGAGQKLVTVSLSTMLKKPETKKSAWKDLQKALEFLK